ncbi:kinase subunit of RNA polymerase II carboxy-terminal domain kinase I [Podila humilis]|nr:kinase subunit of RNA polymerase II carboxy-terminal domain kinase I [Podila humilis]
MNNNNNNNNTTPAQADAALDANVLDASLTEKASQSTISVSDTGVQDPAEASTGISAPVVSTKPAIITASFTVPAVAKPLPTPALPFQSARASESLFSSGYPSSFGRSTARSGAAAAASAAALQLQRELDLQHEILGRKPQLAQDIVTKEPTIQPTFRDYGATRDWRREHSRDRKDRSKERDYERDGDRYSRSRYDRSRERDDNRRDRYSRERSQERERDLDRDRDYRHDRGYRDYRRQNDHPGDREYRRPFSKYDRHERYDRYDRSVRHERRERYYKETKEYDSRSTHRDVEFDEARARSARPEGQEVERERTLSGSGGQWLEGDDDTESRGSKTNDYSHYEHRRGRSIDRHHSRHRPPESDHHQDYHRHPSIDYHRDHRRRSSADLGFAAGAAHDSTRYRDSEGPRTPDSASQAAPPTQPASHDTSYPPSHPTGHTSVHIGHIPSHSGPPPPPPPPPPAPVHPNINSASHTTFLQGSQHPANYTVPHPPSQIHPHQVIQGVHPGAQAGMDPTLPHQYIAPLPSTLQLKGEDLYERVGQVGEGTYGKVYKARNKQTGEYVALKRIRMETERDGFPITAMREIKLLQSLNHHHVVSLKELMVSKGAVYMVFEYMDHDLTGILGHPDLKFEPEHIKCLMKQLLEGLGFLHHKGVLHRDIKGSNLLVNKLGDLKLADFGLARLFQKKVKRDYTNRVITLWYRPPELLLGATAYGPEVDMWSAGCIMVELFTRKPIFQGHNEIMQLDNIWRTMGTPQKETWPDVDQLPWYELIKHLNSESRASKFRATFSRFMSPGALDLAEALLSLDPKKRPTAADALNKFSYFTEEDPAACAPADLPKIEGDWHEYESKQRKKAGTKPKQQHSQSHTVSSRQPSQGPASDKEDQVDDDKESKVTRHPSKKHTLGGSLKELTIPDVPGPEPSTSFSETMGTTMTEIEPEPKRRPTVLPEYFVPPPNVSPSYLPYSALQASRVTTSRTVEEIRTVPTAGTQSLSAPPPPPPPLPTPLPPLQLSAMPVYNMHGASAQPLNIQSHPNVQQIVAESTSLHGRYPNSVGAMAEYDLKYGPFSETTLSQKQTTEGYSGDHQQPAHEAENLLEHDLHAIPIPTGPAGYTKGYHDGHDRNYGYYGRNRHYGNYGRERERDRERDRDRYRDYNRRREYRSRDWSREREREQGGPGSRDRDRGGREYDWYRDHAGRDRDRTGVRDGHYDDEEQYSRHRRDRERERNYEREFEYGHDRDRGRGHELEAEHYRERDPGGGERDSDQGIDSDRDRDREFNPEQGPKREHAGTRGLHRDGDYDRYKEADRDGDFERDLDRERQRVRNHSRDYGCHVYEDKAMESRTEAANGEDEECSGNDEEQKDEDGQRSEFRPSSKRQKFSTDTSSLSSPSTLTTLSSLT